MENKNDPQRLCEEQVEKYLRHKMRIIPAKFRSKRPYGRNWNKKWNPYVVRKYFRKHNYKGFNYGLLLGKVMDVEGDTPEANELLDQMLQGIPHPVYSSHKSQHHLFKNSFRWLTRVVVEDIEFRAYKHHSLIPPSVHPNGTNYTWIDENNFKIPPIPEVLIDFLRDHNRIPRHNSPMISPWCSECNRQVTLPKPIFEIELLAMKMIGISWRCNKCRTPALRAQIKTEKKRFKKRPKLRKKILDGHFNRDEVLKLTTKEIK